MIYCFAQGAVGTFKVKASVDDDVVDLKKLVLEDGKYRENTHGAPLQ
jgi:hypothetical protein